MYALKYMGGCTKVICQYTILYKALEHPWILVCRRMGGGGVAFWNQLPWILMDGCIIFYPMFTCGHTTCAVSGAQ